MSSRATQAPQPTRRPRRRGNVVVEHALALPILFLLFFGLWEFARAEMIRQSMATAAFEGARQGVIPGATTQKVRTTARAILNAARIQASIDVTSISQTTPTVTVTIRANMNRNSWVAPFFYRNRQIVSRFTLQREGFN